MAVYSGTIKSNIEHLNILHSRLTIGPRKELLLTTIKWSGSIIYVYQIVETTDMCSKEFFWALKGLVTKSHFPLVIVIISI